jgi:integrase
MATGQRKDGRWYVYGRAGYWPDEPTRTNEYFGRGPGAERLARERDAQLGGGTKKARLDPSGPTFYEVAVEYLRHKVFSPNSQREIGYMLSSIILPAIGHRTAIRLTHADLDKYVADRRRHRTKKGTYIKDSTIRRELVAVKAILNWSTKRRPPLIAFNPIATYVAPESDDAIILPPTPDEAAAIYGAASDHLKRAILLAHYLGLRPGAVELLSLRWSMVSIDVGIISVRSAHKGGPKMRDVPAHPELIPHLRRWMAEDKAAWKVADIGSRPIIHYHGRSIKAIQNSWAGAKSRAGIKRRIRPYDLRHAFASKALESGADIGAVSHVMGSAPETIRRHYQHVSRELTRRTVALIPALDTTSVVVSASKVKKRRKTRA